MEDDVNGGIHLNWMPYTKYLKYRYAAPGQTLDNSATRSIDSYQTKVVGSGGLYATPAGTVHMIMGHDRALFHSYNTTVNGSFSKPTDCSGAYDTINDHYSAVGSDGTDKVYVSWGEQYSSGANYVKLSVKEAGVWTIYTVDPESYITSNSKPCIAMTNQAGYLLWRHMTIIYILANMLYSSLKVTAPNGGESMSPGSSQEISWTAGDATGNIKIELVKGQTVLGTIANNLDINSSPYNWTAGNYVNAAGAPQTAPIAGDYLIKLSKTDNTYTDSSDAYFSLADPSLYPGCSQWRRELGGWNKPSCYLDIHRDDCQCSDRVFQQ